MTPDQYQRVGELYHQALELEREQRLAFLDRECADDAVLRREVESLIASHEEEETFLAAPAVEVVVKQLAEEGVLSISQEIGHYRVLSLLGKGGMGEVYLAQDTKLNRKVALKVLPAEFTQDAERVRRFEREARAASALNHPNILAIHEIGQTDIGHYIITEFVEGETLRQRCEQTKVSLLEALEISIQIASALAAAHEAGVIHRDIKPENVMVRRDGYVKVLDFGLAKLMDKTPEDPPEGASKLSDTTTPGVVMGTVAYMSPEQARGLKVDARTDIWSLGVLLYEIVTGARPFNGSTTSDTIAAILDKEPLSLSQYTPDAPAELEQIVAKALEKEREHRYQTAGDLLLNLKRIKRQLESGAESAGTAHLGSIGSKQKLSRLSSALGVAALTLIVGGIAVGLYWRISQRASQTKAARDVPFTSFPGSENFPAFSPDGNQIAFVWTGEADDNTDIYVKQINSETPLRLTNDPARDTNPVWSPDGQKIAFVRINYGRDGRGIVDPGESGIFIIPALGGAERRLLLASSAKLAAIGPTISWSTDGKLIAFVGIEPPWKPAGLFLLSVDNLEVSRLTLPPASNGANDSPVLVDTNPTFSPDGKTIAFVRFTNGSRGSLHVVSIQGGEPRHIPTEQNVSSGIAWTPDGRELVFSSSGSLWRIQASGGTPERISIGAGGSSPAFSRQGNRLAYVEDSRDTNIWRVEVPSPPGRPKPPTKFISSSRRDGSPQYSPDGKRIVFTSSRSGSVELWACDSEGGHPIQMTSFGGPRIESPRWSPNGRQIAFESRAEGNPDIYVIDSDGGKPRRLTTMPSWEMAPSWSRDGNWVYFTLIHRESRQATRAGQLLKIPIGGGQPVQVTKQGAWDAFESPDGRFVYFTKVPTTPGLWRIPVAGGEEVLISDRVYGDYWAITERGVFFITPITYVNQEGLPTPTLDFLDFATGKTTPIVKIEKPLFEGGAGLTVSPDGKWILYKQLDRRESDIILVENFR